MSSPATIPAALAHHAGERADAVAVRSKRHGLWHTLTFGQLAARVAAVAGGLRQLDVQAGAPVALVAENSPHWIVCDLAIQSIGARSVALSPQMPPDVAARVLAGSGATVIICGDQEQVDLVLDAGAALDGVSALVLIDSTGTSRYDDPRLRSLHELEEAGAGAHARADAAGSIVMFSGGTEADPRAAELDKSAVAAVAAAAVESLELSARDRNLTVLSLATPAARVLDLYAPLLAGAEIAVPESPATVLTDLVEIQPTLLALSPRAVELLRQASVRHSRESSRLRRRVYNWAMDKLGARLDKPEARTADGARRGRGLAYLLVGRFVASDLGMRRTRRILVTGGPVAGRDARFFWALGVPLLETYGQAELGGLAYAHTSLDDAGTIGLPLPGISGQVSDGELEVSSPAVDGGQTWHATGDLAEHAGDDRIRVRGRREDVIHAPEGDIVVAGLEAALGESTYIRRAVVAAPGGSELTALVEVDYEETLSWATARDLHFSTYGSLVSSDEVTELVAAEVAGANERLGASATIAEFIVLPRQLTIRDGELTPGLAIRRRAVIDRFMGDPAVKRAPVAPRAEASTAS